MLDECLKDLILILYFVIWCNKMLYKNIKYKIQLIQLYLFLKNIYSNSLIYRNYSII